MTLRWLFFSFEGRINRAIWWGVFLGLGSVFVALGFLTYDERNPTLGTIVGLMLFALQIAPDVKRLHDRSKSGHWLWLYYGAPNVLLLPATLGADAALGSFALLFALFAALGIIVWLFVDLGFLRGTSGDNRFGADPLAGKRRRRRGSI